MARKSCFQNFYEKVSRWWLCKQGLWLFVRIDLWFQRNNYIFDNNIIKIIINNICNKFTGVDNDVEVITVSYAKVVSLVVETTFKTQFQDVSLVKKVRIGSYNQ